MPIFISSWAEIPINRSLKSSFLPKLLLIKDSISTETTGTVNLSSVNNDTYPRRWQALRVNSHTTVINHVHWLSISVWVHIVLRWWLVVHGGVRRTSHMMSKHIWRTRDMLGTCDVMWTRYMLRALCYHMCGASHVTRTAHVGGATHVRWTAHMGRTSHMLWTYIIHITHHVLWWRSCRRPVRGRWWFIYTSLKQNKNLYIIQQKID